MILSGIWFGITVPFGWFEKQQPLVKVAVLLVVVALLLVEFHADEAFLRAMRGTVDLVKAIKTLL